MDKQGSRTESKQQQLPPEVRSALRRRQLSGRAGAHDRRRPDRRRRRHQPDALLGGAAATDGTSPAPEVVAKGQDLVALRSASSRPTTVYGGPRSPSRPAPCTPRSTWASRSPEELFEAVAQLLAFVYRVAARGGRSRMTNS